MSRCFLAGTVQHGAVFGTDKVRLQRRHFCAGGGKERAEVWEASIGAAGARRGPASFLWKQTGELMRRCPALPFIFTLKSH